MAFKKEERRVKRVTIYCNGGCSIPPLDMIDVQALEGSGMKVQLKRKMTGCNASQPRDSIIYILFIKGSSVAFDHAAMN